MTSFRGPAVHTAGPVLLPGHSTHAMERTHHTPRRAARAFTLVEMVLAAALAAVVLIGLQSAVLIASKAIPSGAPVDHAAEGAALDRLAHDLAYALTITNSSVTGITFTVADRTGDAVAETITYSWSAKGAPLLRTMNGSTAETVVRDVQNFALALTTEQLAGAPAYLESNEVPLASFSAASGLAASTIDTSAWVAQIVPVSVPSDAVDFRTTRVRLTVAIAGAATGMSVAELRCVRNQTPTPRTLASALFSEPYSSGVVSLSMPSGRYLDPNEPLAILVRPSATPPSCNVTYKSSGVSGAGLMLTTTDAGATWTSASTRAILYELWGVYRVLDDPTSVTRAVSARISLTAGATPAMEINVALANRPRVTP
jgi:hypothetical protein